MIKGEYIVYENGKEILRSPNIITKFGKRYFTRQLAGMIQNNSKDMAIGISDSKVISAVSGNGTSITFTTTSAHGLSVGNKVSIVNVNPVAYNLSDVLVDTVPTSTTFTVLNTTSTAYVSGGNVSSDVDTRLGFEIYRTPVSLGSTDIQIENDTTTYSIIYKATIPQDVSGVISEIGLYPSLRTSSNSYDSKFIADFDKYFDWTDLNNYSPATSTVGAKVGGNVLTMTSNASSSNEYKTNISLDLEGYSNQDSLTIAYYKEDVNLNKITLKFYSSDSDYYYVDITPQSGTGYKISSDINLSTLFGNIVGSPSKSEIIKIGVVIVPNASVSTSVGIDSLRINDEDTFDPIFGLLSRTILSSPYLTKTAGRQIDIEYRLDLDF
jgi:hypothetical protein